MYLLILFKKKSYKIYIMPLQAPNRRPISLINKVFLVKIHLGGF